MTATEESIEGRIDRLHVGGIVDMHFDLPMDLYEKRDRKNACRGGCHRPTRALATRGEASCARLPQTEMRPFALAFLAEEFGLGLALPDGIGRCRGRGFLLFIPFGLRFFLLFGAALLTLGHDVLLG